MDVLEHIKVLNRYESNRDYAADIKRLEHRQKMEYKHKRREEQDLERSRAAALKQRMIKERMDKIVEKYGKQAPTRS